MKKIFTLLFALCSLSAWAHHFQVGDLYYNITSGDLSNVLPVVEPTEGSVTLVWYPAGFTPDIDNRLVFAGNHDGWNTSPENMVHFEPIEGADGWYKAVIVPADASANPILVGKPCALSTDGTFDWSRQWGGGNCTILKGDAYIEEGYVGEYDFSVIHNSSVIYIHSHGFKSDFHSVSETYLVGRESKANPIEVANGIHKASTDSDTYTVEVTYPAEYSPGNYTNLTSVVIPETVTYFGKTLTVIRIADNTFKNCSGLTSITIPNSVTSIGDEAFRSCYGLASITIPESVTSIGSSAFSGCTGLRSVTIPNSVTSIGRDAFFDCSDLTSITIPNSVTSIGGGAFWGCSRLTSVYVWAEVPPTLGSSVFTNVSKSIPVYVPCGSVSAYQSTEGWKAFTNIQGPLAEYSIAVGVNDNKMGTAKVDENTICGAQISATANYGYHFTKWSDGITDNPRTLELTQDTAFTAEFAQSFSGQCGDNLYWSYDETTKTISITGSGKMYDYTVNTQPWILFKEDIKEVTICNKATSIGISAFEGCISLGKLSIGSAMKNIAADAFAGCKRLYDIYCYAYPPFAEETSFANYKVYLYIPCEYQRDYTLDVVWGKFAFIECIGAESDKTDGDNVTITPGSNDVTITWPTNPKAETYVIVIKQGDKVFCTLTFNKDGMLLNIAFAPSRSGSHPVTYAASTGNGLRFTVTSLDAATTYAYDITSKDAKENTLSTYTGEFTTKSNVSTSVSDIQSPMTDCQKLLRNGQLVIVRDGVEYNAQGQIIKE